MGAGNSVVVVDLLRCGRCWVLVYRIIYRLWSAPVVAQPRWLNLGPTT